ncbi:Uncharacterised protein [uncultured archaeon]|nr:Uncharacterised protein [uncultured archaeon]
MHKEILEDLLKDCPCGQLSCDENNWCFFRELVESTGLSERQIEQARLIYDYKYLQSQREGNDIGKQRATQEFIAQYGKKFAEVYKDGMRNGDLFEAVFGFKKEHTDKQLLAHINNN